MSKLAKFFTPAGSVSASAAVLKMISAVRAGASPEQAAQASGLSVRHVLRQLAKPQIRALTNPAIPTVNVKLTRRVAAAVELMFTGATREQAADQVGLSRNHLRKALDRPEVNLLFKAKTRALLMEAVPRAEAILAEHRARRRASRGNFTTRQIGDARGQDDAN